MAANDCRGPDVAIDSLDVFREEWMDIRRRRSGNSPVAPDEPAPPRKLVGLALSGGGIRSATFNLGVLQALQNLLPHVDYLSTVSGGGYTGGWWSAWRAREPRPIGAFPPREGVETWRHVVAAANVEQVRHARPWTPDPVHHVRLFSNYLTPRKGALSRDLWRAVTVVSRNLVLTWAALLPFVLVAVMVAYAAFLWIHAPFPDGAAHMQLADDSRLRAVLGIPTLFLAAFVVLSIVWVLAQRGTYGPQAVVAFVAISAVIWSIWTARAGRTDVASAWSPTTTELLIVGLVLAVGAIRIVRWVPGERLRDVLLNWVSRLQGVTLVASLLAAVIGIVAAYGPSVVSYLLGGQQMGGVERWAKDIGAYTGLLTWAVSTGYTALKGAPAGGGEAKGRPSSRLSRTLIAIAPPLTMVMILLVTAWLTEQLVVSADHSLWNPVLRRITLIGAIAMAFYAVSEHWIQARPRPLWVAGIPALAAIATAVVALTGAGPAPIIAGSLVGLAAVLVLTVDSWIPDRVRRLMPTWTDGAACFDRAMLLVAATCVLTLGAGVVDLELTILLGKPEVPGYVPDDIRLLLGMAAFLFTTVILLGWTTDPNTLSLHNFYKMRLVRAYLGASNRERILQDAEDITETRAQDDIRLAKLSAGDGPYHLIHGTLNLTTGSDLVVAQRAAVPFLFSRRFCGSARTGFRRTAEYRSGTLTLGTAVAISGAAASPVMGSQTPSTATSMLLALLNVRLGYWLPTPSGTDWQAPQARLWPFYLLSEFFSHLADTGSHCYVTDGGHFDNTGVYSLVERGCSTIVLTDCGADPDTVFDDLSNLVRRARIDFGAIVTFPSLGVFSRSTLAADRNAFVVGSIKYARPHLKALGWAEEDIEGAEGKLIVIKPTLWGTLETDVNRYSQQQPEFPQQSTADQWFDEAQFESYRRLGEISGTHAYDTVRQSVVLVVQPPAGVPVTSAARGSGPLLSSRDP